MSRTLSAEWKKSVSSDIRFEHTDYVVDDVDYHELWAKWHYQYGVAPWEQDFGGAMRTIGEIAGRPICVTVFWYIVGDFRVGEDGELVARMEARATSMRRPDVRTRA